MRQLARGVRRDGVPHGAAVSARPDRWLGFLAASRSQCLSLSDYVTVTGPRGGEVKLESVDVADTWGVDVAYRSEIDHGDGTAGLMSPTLYGYGLERESACGVGGLKA